MAAHSDTPAQALLRTLRKELQRQRPTRSDRDICHEAAQRGPAAFAREILRIEPWSQQREILEALPNNYRLAWTSGHKNGKSDLAAIAALWFYCCFPGGRVVITATTDNQVNGIIWRAIKRMVRRAKRGGIVIPGSEGIHEIASSGLVDPLEDSEIKGYTAKDSEAIAGVSGPAILYLVDEASGVKNHIFEAIQGNRAGGNAWVVLTSNPTRADGENYDAHHSKSQEALGPTGYRCFHTDSRNGPNCTGEWRDVPDWDFEAACWRKRTKPIPGLATPEWVAEMLRDYGEDSPIFAVRVRGDFAVAEAAKIFPLAMLEAAAEAWADAPAAGRLFIGFDPAGSGEGGDESAFAPRRDKRIFEVRAKAGMTDAEHFDTLCDLIDTWDPPAARKTGAPLPLVVLDGEGEVGARTYTYLQEHAREGGFEVFRVRSSEKAIRKPKIYDRIRDELAANLRAWVREGGGLPAHAKLTQDLHTLEWSETVQGRLKLIAKKELRKILGRSPDPGDAAMLSVWEPRYHRGTSGGGQEREERQGADKRFDAYRNIDRGDHSRTFDPYGS